MWFYRDSNVTGYFALQTFRLCKGVDTFVSPGRVCQKDEPSLINLGDILFISGIAKYYQLKQN